MSTQPQNGAMPVLAGWLGFAGLLPQVGVIAVLLAGPPGWRTAALAIGLGYAGLILSFIGGLWWGMAAAARAVPNWVHVVAVVPSLWALAAVSSVALGGSTTTSFIIVGVGLVATLAIDRALAGLGICPSWWMALRVPLSSGLGALTLLAAVIG